jgi:ribosomal protein L24E
MRGRSAITVNLSGPENLSCSWCGADVEPNDGFRLGEHEGDRGAVFCRLEHVVPWAMQGAHWEAGEPPEPSGIDDGRECAHCGARLEPGHLLLVRHRGEHRIPDGFCSIDHLLEWAKAGGRWQS